MSDEYIFLCDKLVKAGSAVVGPIKFFRQAGVHAGKHRKVAISHIKQKTFFREFAVNRVSTDTFREHATSPRFRKEDDVGVLRIFCKLMDAEAVQLRAEPEQEHAAVVERVKRSRSGTGENMNPRHACAKISMRELGGLSGPEAIAGMIYMD